MYLEAGGFGQGLEAGGDLNPGRGLEAGGNLKPGGFGVLDVAGFGKLNPGGFWGGLGAVGFEELITGGLGCGLVVGFV